MTVSYRLLGNPHRNQRCRRVSSGVSSPPRRYYETICRGGSGNQLLYPRLLCRTIVSCYAVIVISNHRHDRQEVALESMAARAMHFRPSGMIACTTSQQYNIIAADAD